MLAKKNRICGAILFLTLAIFISGCTPPGPRALLEGKKCLDRGDYAEAVAQFRTATTLLPANAQASPPTRSRLTRARWRWTEI